jgi:hypothetical protein
MGDIVRLIGNRNNQYGTIQNENIENGNNQYRTIQNENIENGNNQYRTIQNENIENGNFADFEEFFGINGQISEGILLICIFFVIVFIIIEYCSKNPDYSTFTLFASVYLITVTSQLIAFTAVLIYYHTTLSGGSISFILAVKWIPESSMLEKCFSNYLIINLVYHILIYYGANDRYFWFVVGDILFYGVLIFPLPVTINQMFDLNVPTMLRIPFEITDGQPPVLKYYWGYKSVTIKYLHFISVIAGVVCSIIGMFRIHDDYLIVNFVVSALSIFCFAGFFYLSFLEPRKKIATVFEILGLLFIHMVVVRTTFEGCSVIRIAATNIKTNFN